MNIMDDVERAIDDGVNVVKSMTRDARFVPGKSSVRTISFFDGEAAYGLASGAARREFRQADSHLRYNGF